MRRPPASPNTSQPKRGDVFWVEFDPTRGAEIRKARPAVVVSADGLNRARRTVIVIPLSTGPDPRPPIVIATPSFGDKSVAVCDQLRAVDKSRLGRGAGTLNISDIRAVESALRAVLAL